MDGVGEGAPDGQAATAGTSANEERPQRNWDEGLTKEERAEAKRKYKNRRGAERWRRRKWEQLLRSVVDPAAGVDGSASTPALQDGASGDQDGNLPNALQPPGAASAEDQMLHEYKRLGKVEEVELLSKLEQIASYSMIPQGFQRYKAEILFLAEESIGLTRGGGSSPTVTAQQYLRYGHQPRPEWFSPETPSFFQVCAAFAQGQEDRILVPLSVASSANVRYTLRRFSQLPKSMHIELYMAGIQEIAALLPITLGNDPEAATAISAVSQKCREVLMLLATYSVGLPGTFSILRTVHKPAIFPIAQLMSAAVWSRRCQKLAPLQAALPEMEREIEQVAQALDHTRPHPYLSLLEKVRGLLQMHKAIHEISFCADLECFVEILTPFQVAIIAAAQLPRISASQALLEGVDPVLRMSIVFENGLIPYRPS